MNVWSYVLLRPETLHLSKTKATDSETVRCVQNSDACVVCVSECVVDCITIKGQTDVYMKKYIASREKRSTENLGFDGNTGKATEEDSLPSLLQEKAQQHLYNGAMH